METFVGSFLVVFGVILLFVGAWLLIRNFKVFKFQIYLNEQGYNICKKHLDSVEHFDEKAWNEHELLENIWREITDISYAKMLFSFKPLKPEYWLNEKQLDFLRINKFD